MYMNLFQILSTLDIVIPLHTIMSIFKVGVQRLQTLESEDGPSDSKSGPQMFSTTSPTDQVTPPLSPEKCHRDVVEMCDVYERETEVIVACYIMMLDLCLKQVLHLNIIWKIIFHFQTFFFFDNKIKCLKT